MSGEGLKLVLILGSVRNGRMADRVAKCVSNSVAKSSTMQLAVVDPLALAPSCDLNKQPMHFLQNPEQETPLWLKKTNETFQSANGFIVACPEYNGLMPPALLNLMNSVPPASFRHRPVGIVTYTMGLTGAMRALMILRPYLNELGMLCVPRYVPIPTVHQAIDDGGTCTNKLVNENLVKLIRNVEWYARAIDTFKQNGNALID
ncbi:unnamed protein product [Orchesella dallaii]|uniref:NADPH-dependent FMN reductase-like domain-containing protein n=1 Tax=Orchesella dallaii TaxID=48710 RepID=A0ABP1QHJ2_9HEXA